MNFIVTTLNFKDVIDLPKWRTLAVSLIPAASVPSYRVAISDLRNNEDMNPFIYFGVSSNQFQLYNTKTDEWLDITSLSLATLIVAGFYMSAQGPRGTIAAGATTTSIPLSTALPATVGVNQLANRGDGRGFKVRIIGNAAGSSGLTEERYVIANTGETTTPVIRLDSPLSFVPIAGDTYEFLSGRIFLLAGSNTAGAWKYYDVLTNSFSGNLATAGLPVTFSDANLVGLDELLVPYNRSPGEGFLGILTATASGAASLTGQAVGGDAGVVADQYRNFQIRIVQDVAIPTAVGQRRNITTHTAGPSPVYTVPAWAVVPSANAVYVIENNGDRILAWCAGSLSTFTYTISGNAWDANITFGVRPGILASGAMSHQAFSIVPDLASPSNSRQSHIFSFRGGTTNTIDLLDISGGAAGLWTGNITYGNKTTYTTFSPGSGSTQDPATMEGRYMYIVRGINNYTSQRFYRFDIKNRILEPYTFFRIPISTVASTVAARHTLANTTFIDGNTKLSFIIFLPNNPDETSILAFGLPIIR